MALARAAATLLAGCALLAGSALPSLACFMAIIDGDTALVCAWDMAYLNEVEVTGRGPDITLDLPSGPVRLREGVRSVTHAGRTTTLTRTPMMYDGDLFVPARFLAQVLGCSFEYVPEKRFVVAQTKQGKFPLGILTLSEVEVEGADTLYQFTRAIERAVARSDWRGCYAAMRLAGEFPPADGVSYPDLPRRRAMEAFRSRPGFRFPALTRVSDAQLRAVRAALGGEDLGLRPGDYYGGDRANGFWVFRKGLTEWALLGLVKPGEAVRPR